MKQRDDKWTIRFRKRMEGYVELPPSGVWERLDEELSFNCCGGSYFAIYIGRFVFSYLYF